MPHLFTSTSVEDVIRKSIGRSNQPVDPLQTKGTVRLLAPLLFWSGWVEIYAQFGVTGPDSDQHVTKVLVTFDNNMSRLPSAFGVEIKGGDNLVSTIGPGSAFVTITGNVATALSLRSYGFTSAQNVLVTAS